MQIKLHHIPGAWNLGSLSPFCLKIETYLKMAGHDHEIILDGNPGKGPKGKLPWVDIDGKKIGDSNFIIDHLKQETGVDLNKDLTDEQRAQAQALKRLIEENLYWVMVYDRWVIEENWQGFKDIVLGEIPALIRPLIALIARRSVKRALRGHGIGLHSLDEIHQIGIADLKALSDFLGDKPFMMGDEPTEIDATAYGQIANIIQTEIASPVKDAGLQMTNLLPYCERMQGRYFAS